MNFFLSNTSIHWNELLNYERLLDNNQQETGRKSKQLILEDIRANRGHVNGCGSIIKIFTGNWDQKDARKYNQDIQNLKNSQDQFMKISKQQIKLISAAMENFDNTIIKITRNQQLIQTKIVQLQNLI